MNAEHAEQLAAQIRIELSDLARAQYGDFKTVARMLHMPEKTVYRYLTLNGKDQRMPPMQFVIELSALLQRDAGGPSFAELVARASKRILEEPPPPNQPTDAQALLVP